MAPSVLQAPIRREPTHSAGPRVFRKQLLPADKSITYKGRRIDFGRDYLAKLVDHFRSAAFDSVPFLLAGWDNKHSLDPERVRGEVKGLELTDDGLDAIVELTDEGAQVVRDNPKLGVSARIIEEGHPEIECPRKVPAIEHVLGTIQPRVNGMRDWEAVSDLSTSYPAAQVIDLTAETYEQMPGTDADTQTLTDEQKTALKDAGISEDQYEAVAQIFAKPGEGEGKEAGTPAAASTEPEEKKDKPTGLRAILAAITGRKPEEFKDEEIAALEGGEPKEEKEPEEVALSAPAQQAIDSAAADSAQAKTDADAARSELADLRFSAEKERRTKAGVPPALIDLCEPVIRRGPNSGVIELSSGENFDAHKFVTNLLDEAEGTIDLSSEFGRALSEDDQERAEAQEMAEKLGEAG
jgi:hypothetical protein